MYLPFLSDLSRHVGTGNLKPTTQQLARVTRFLLQSWFITVMCFKHVFTHIYATT